jgi:cholesterol transport system auxiliary component
MTSRSPTTAAALVIATTGASLLAGCSGLFETKGVAETVYELRAPAAAPLSPPIAGEIVVLRPLARPGLDTDRIVVTLPDRRLDAYRGARWSAPAPDLVQSMLLEGLRARTAWQTVLPDRGEFRGRYALQTELRDFQADYAEEGAAPTVHVTLRGDLGRAPERVPIVSAVGSGEARATSNRMRDVAAAFESAYAAAATQLVDAIHAGAVAARPGESKPATPTPQSRAGAPAAP